MFSLLSVFFFSAGNRTNTDSFDPPLADAPFLMVDMSTTSSPQSKSDQSHPVHASSHVLHVPTKIETTQFVEKLVCAGIASCAAAAATHGIDTLKVRLQIYSMNYPASSIFSSSYSAGHRGMFVRMHSIWSTFHGSIIGADGVRGLYRGLAPSLLREATYSSIRLGGYDACKDFVQSVFGEPQSHTALFRDKMIAGMCSGLIGASVTTPVDVVKLRAQAALKGGSYVGPIHEFQKIYRLEGWRGLFRGCIPNTQRAAVLTAAQLSTYDESKQWLLDRGWSEGLRVYAVASMICGLFTTILVSPIDVVKTRTMVGVGGKTMSTIAILSHIVKTEGFQGCYRGALSNWIRIFPHTAISFGVYEELRSAVGLSHL
ncbi:mitochondrial solute carrier family 25 (mitochondrial carrier) member 14/30 [Andalucia godoyi]|uniref:Mitochondrial solute carrier family 25 (Mitochondrial carrier) member 14/30 n=1 Tax=Andalucia godoyi TaxID=505711 RepID=A0A8K0F311_ANDGO|nr:mitochondrial solute carrier family 25 (mitochondrial carrier) member 14/30 [Andalucia godoyi]|eukprot:ANDGO_04765.mRNA.1 mitochondrial solute carrier family 25 (mitochondrial oxoglutarate transporter) member 11